MKKKPLSKPLSETRNNNANQQASCLFSNENESDKKIPDLESLYYLTVKY